MMKLFTITVLGLIWMTSLSARDFSVSLQSSTFTKLPETLSTETELSAKLPLLSSSALAPPSSLPVAEKPLTDRNAYPSVFNKGNKKEYQLSMTDAQYAAYAKNKRLLYSSLWAFASLNYLYADLVGLMDSHVHAQYESGTVEGMEITPEFLTGAALLMQVPMANVFLPHLIKNDRTLRWVQIASGAFMTLVQTSTLFVGEAQPYYVLFSAIEIGTTAFITINALKWKTRSLPREF